MDTTKTKYRHIGTLGATAAGKLIYSYLSDLSGKKGKVQISTREISRTIAISKKAVSRNLHRLQKGGYIEIKPVYHPDGGRTANLYEIR